MAAAKPDLIIGGGQGITAVQAAQAYDRLTTVTASITPPSGPAAYVLSYPGDKIYVVPSSSALPVLAKDTDRVRRQREREVGRRTGEGPGVGPAEFAR
ncbi:MAG: hypothetical protein L0I76_32190 [Pseudonocardia sp.]|nr:hypothetical protein [Pseudonocardia sp.]